MPLYEYACTRCGRTLEELRRPGESEAPACPDCGAPTARVPSIPAPPSCGTAGRAAGRTCCGREERCDRPPCGEGGACGSRG